jgi:hypothetical protein
MKNILLYCFLLICSGILSGKPFKTDIDFQRMKEDDPNYKLERKKWMEDMHRTAPGVDWRAVNEQTMHKKHQLSKEKIEALLRSNIKVDKIQSDTVAGGKLIG